MNVLFFGTPEFAIPSLDRLHQHHHVLGVISQPDRPRGRGWVIQASAVSQHAQALGLRVFTPERWSELTWIQQTPLDAIVVAAYGRLLPTWLLEHPTWGCINVHASLLPRWRGASPIHHALLHGDAITGISIMQMEAGMDTGGYWLQKSIAIKPEDDRVSLEQALAHLGAEALHEVLEQKLYQQEATAQEMTQVTHAPKIETAMTHYDPRDSAKTLFGKIRAFAPLGIRAMIQGQPVRLLSAKNHHEGPSEGASGTLLRVDREGLWIACPDGEICISNVQLASQKARSIEQLRHGWPKALTLGHQLASPSTVITA